MKGVVFLAFANDARGRFLAQLKRESSTIRDLFFPLHQQGQIEIVREESLTPRELSRLLSQYKDRIVLLHYAGHADGEGLLLEDGGGHVEGLSTLFGLQKNLQLLFLNGCTTQGQVIPYLEAGVPAVIATDRNISDVQASLFAEQFYQAFLNGHTLEEAFNAAIGFLKTRFEGSLPEANPIIFRGQGLPQLESDEAPWGLFVKEDQIALLNAKIDDLIAVVQELESKNKPSLKKKMTSILGLIAIVIGILAGLAEVTGWSIRDFFSGADAKTETLTVLTHGKRGLDDILIPNRGEVSLLYGNAKYVRQINDQGEAIFQEIPEVYFAKGEVVKLLFTDPEGEPYRASFPDSAYQLQGGKAIELLVTLEGMDEINGVIKDFVTGDYIPNARIRVSGIDTVSNEFGEFTLTFPESKLQKFVTIRVIKEGYKNYEISQVPTTTDQEIIIPLQPK